LKTVTDYLWFTTRRKREFINITDKVKQLVDNSGVKEGFVLVSAMHITAGVYVNDAEEGLIQDIEEWLEKLAPFNPDYSTISPERPTDAHLKAY
jgi:secondary thiamine-phosphate synthase enzyme